MRIATSYISLTVIEFSNGERKNYEIIQGDGSTLTAVENISAITNVAFIKDCVVISIGREIFIFRKDEMILRKTLGVQISFFTINKNNLLLVSEFDLFKVNLAAIKVKLFRLWSSSSGLIDNVEIIDGSITVEVGGEKILVPSE